MCFVYRCLIVTILNSYPVALHSLISKRSPPSEDAPEHKLGNPGAVDDDSEDSFLEDHEQNIILLAILVAVAVGFCALVGALLCKYCKRRSRSWTGTNNGGESCTGCFDTISSASSLRGTSYGRNPTINIYDSHQINDERVLRPKKFGVFPNMGYQPDDSGMLRVSDVPSSKYTSARFSSVSQNIENERNLGDSDSLLEISERMFETYPETPKSLFVPTSRSQVMEVEDKLIVYITKQVSSKGDILILDNMGISLTVPAGAIPENEHQLIILALNWDLSDNPQMEEEQALVSPVVYCGPHGVQLQTPALLRYKHCAFDPRDIRVMQSQTDLTSSKNWEPYCNQQDQENELKYKISADECQVLLDHFTLFTSIQTPVEGTGHKWLQVAAFAPVLKPGIEHCPVRVYFLNKTPCALAWAKHNEAKFGHEMVCPEKVFLLKGSKEDVQLQVLYLSRDWKIINTNRQEQVNFLHIWHGMCPHTAFCFSRNVTDNSFPTEIGLNFSLFQESSVNEPDKIIIQMAETTSKPFLPLEQGKRHRAAGFDQVRLVVRPGSRKSKLSSSSAVKRLSKNAKDVSVIVSEKDLANSERQLQLEIEQIEDADDGISLRDFQYCQGARIPIDLRKKLIQLLAPTQHICADWKDFAEAMGVHCVQYLETLQCPTTVLLNFFETNYTSLDQLYHILKSLKRVDAATVVAEEMGWVSSRPDATEDSDEDNNRQ